MTMQGHSNGDAAWHREQRILAQANYDNQEELKDQIAALTAQRDIAVEALQGLLLFPDNPRENRAARAALAKIKEQK